MMKQQKMEVAFCNGYYKNNLSWTSIIIVQQSLVTIIGILQIGKKLAVLGGVLSALTQSSPIFAGSVYAQLPLDTTTSNSFVTTDPDGSDGDTWTYDDFIATQSGAVSNVTWQGQANPNTGFTIQILTAQPSTPDTIGPSQVVETINVLDNASQIANKNGLFDFYIDLTKPFAMIAGTHYWLTVYSNGPVPWGWGNGKGANNKSISFNRGQAMWLPAPGDRTFSLNYQ